MTYNFNIHTAINAAAVTRGSIPLNLWLLQMHRHYDRKESLRDFKNQVCVSLTA